MAGWVVGWVDGWVVGWIGGWIFLPRSSSSSSLLGIILLFIFLSLISSYFLSLLHDVDDNFSPVVLVFYHLLSSHSFFSASFSLISSVSCEWIVSYP